MKKGIFWHRRDLRINDNAGLFKSLKICDEVQPIFIFDKSILNSLPSSDQRVLFIYNYILRLKEAYQEVGVDLWVFYGNPIEIVPHIAQKDGFNYVFTNRDYEPYALERDKKIFKLLEEKNIEFQGAKDHVIFEKNEVMKENGTPYTVFTPYARKWKATLKDSHLSTNQIENYVDKFRKSTEFTKIPSLEEMGFRKEQLYSFPNIDTPDSVLSNYTEKRNFPVQKGTSRLSVHLRFGTISIRELTKRAKRLNETFLNEIIWRDFYQMIIFHFPYTVNSAFKPAYDQIDWEKNEVHFKAWCEGKTGYPLVDAGMRELNETGFMHNRVRMVVASFLTKHLLIDWRWGEAYFAEKLLDFELASNIGGWQWAAGCGCDAAPYFRVFNPTSQQEKFDKSFEYIKKWVPEFGTSTYPKPIIEHAYARNRVLDRYKKALNTTK